MMDVLFTREHQRGPDQSAKKTGSAKLYITLATPHLRPQRRPNESAARAALLLSSAVDIGGPALASSLLPPYHCIHQSTNNGALARRKAPCTAPRRVVPATAVA
ncbi:MAG TPA: hypothetical protein VNH11_32610 [Pirellulales bacterium]|nr:hypothetical protein [Pirellulales bacterium]